MKAFFEKSLFNPHFGPNTAHQLDIIGEGYIHRLCGIDLDFTIDKDGDFIMEWGEIGEGPCEFRTPHALAFDSQDGSSSPTVATTASRYLTGMVTTSTRTISSVVSAACSSRRTIRCTQSIRSRIRSGTLAGRRVCESAP